MAPNGMEVGVLNNIKRVKVSNKPHAFLHLQILKVQGKACGVLSWLNPWDEHETYIVNGFPSPYSNTRETFYLGHNPYSYEFLNLDVMRFTSNNEPGTSNGIVIMGNAKIPLPKVFNTTIVECFELEKANFEKGTNEVVGRIVLSMKLEVV